MPIRFPAPLAPGDTIAVTSPSSGVPDRLVPRLDHAVSLLRDGGFSVTVGDCMDGTGVTSAPARDRAAELNAFLIDPAVRAIVPPWGGETAIDLLPLLDWAAIAAAEPTWLVGYSDMSTVLTPLTLLTGIATVHGNNLMDSPYVAPDGLLHWLDIATAPRSAVFAQHSPGVFRAQGQDDWEADPAVSEFSFDGTGSWTRFDAESGPVDIAGRLIGGCIETLCNLAGTAYGDVSTFADEHAPEGLIVYIEACEDDAPTICRNLHGMRLAGFFDAADLVLVGRTSAPDAPGMTQREAVVDALGGLGVPIIGDVECGHVPPFLPLVNGALARVRFDDDHRTITQQLI